MNIVVLIGRLTKNPEVRYTTNQKVVCSFTLAVDRPFVNQQGVREADFIPIVLWGKTAEIAGNSCVKGHRLCVEGRIQVRTYEDKNKKTVWVTEVIGDHIEFIERKADPAAAAVTDSNPDTRTAAAFTAMGEEVPSEEEVPF